MTCEENHHDENGNQGTEPLHQSPGLNELVSLGVDPLEKGK